MIKLFNRNIIIIILNQLFITLMRFLKMISIIHQDFIINLYFLIIIIDIDFIINYFRSLKQILYHSTKLFNFNFNNINP